MHFKDDSTDEEPRVTEQNYVICEISWLNKL